MLDDVYIGYTALALTLGLRVPSRTGLPRRVEYLAPPPVCRIKMKASREMSCSTTTTSKLAGLFSTLFQFAERQAGSCKYHFLKSFGMTRLGK